jgi:hypothetical protein
MVFDLAVESRARSDFWKARNLGVSHLVMALYSITHEFILSNVQVKEARCTKIGQRTWGRFQKVVSLSKIN